ncbi:MAG: YdcF family protein [Alphaproteobacteria bacterium]|nr:YdcF family protein [Alphaproteobacteria bacterium]
MTRIILPSFFHVTVSVLCGLAAAWVFGFFVFFGIVTSQKPEMLDKPADLTVVLTGGTGRVEEGFDLLAKGESRALLISGVHPDVNLQNLVDLWGGEKDVILKHCCVTLGRKADDTESNATETAEYITGKDIKTIRIVTSNYHMPRAWILFRRALPENITLALWPVTGLKPTSPTFWRNMFVEYTKTLLTWMS